MSLMRANVVPSAAFMMGSLLLVLSANCSLEKQTVGNPAGNVGVMAPVDEQAEDVPIADNSFCYVCHINYDGEELTVHHELAGIGCEQCHGRSSAHCSDENNITPPEIMYSKAKVNPSCLNCHPRDEIGEEETHERIFSGGATEQRYCTDCHGRQHRVNVRTVRWDKSTGELLKQ